MRGVGEIQSPPGSSTTQKNRAFSQAGMYTLGRFVNTSSNRLASVILYKDLSAHVALATILRKSEPQSDVVGDVEYKLVYSLAPFTLTDQEEFELFCSVFIATLKICVHMYAFAQRSSRGF